MCSAAALCWSGLSEDEKAEETAEFFRNVAAEFDSEINFTYCTEFVVDGDPEVQKGPPDLRLLLETIGDCVVVVDDDEIIKTHVHTENPGDVAGRPSVWPAAHRQD